MPNNFEEFKEKINDQINSLTSRTTRLEEKDIKIEGYKIFLYPKSIFNYISNLMDLQSNQELNYEFFPVEKDVIVDLLKDKNFNPCNLKPEKIKYDPKINYEDLFKICEFISNQGWSGFNFLENIENNIDLNKPLLLYYGVMQLGVFFSNFHFNFTPENRSLSSFKNLNTHGFSHHEINQIEFEFNEKSLLSKKIKFKKSGVGLKFFLTYHPSEIEHFSNQEEISLKDLLKNYFDYSSKPIKTLAQHTLNYQPPDVKLKSKAAGIYLLSYFFSMLSRYKMHTWVKLLDYKRTNLSYLIKYFLKFASSEFIDIIFNTLENTKRTLPMMSRIQRLL